jgi:hypothetical protein
MGNLGSGRWKKPGRRTVESGPALDVSYLAARGWLRPGEVGTWPLTVGNAVILISLRAEIDYLRISRRPVDKSSGWISEEQEGVAMGIQIGRVPRYFGGTRPYFVCPGNPWRDGQRKDGQRKAASPREDDPREDDPRTADTTATEAGTPDAAATTESGTGGAAGCGRRVRRLYFSRGRLLCRHCCRLSYTGNYEKQPWQRAARRANKLRVSAHKTI